MILATQISKAELTAIRTWLTHQRHFRRATGPIPAAQLQERLAQDNDTIGNVLRRLAVTAWMDGIEDIPCEPGTCFACGCTETDACNPPCGWADSECTICTTCDDAAKEGE